MSFYLVILSSSILLLCIAMKRMILICLSYYAVVSFVIEEGQISNLGFKNETGINTTQAQVNSFINFINSASAFYRDDTYTRLAYISDQMKKTYGKDNNNFSVIQQGNDKYFGQTGFTSDQFYATVAPGVDKVFPNNSYMFFNSISGDERFFINFVGQKGEGIDSAKETVIKNIILSAQTTSNCTCATVNTIETRLKQFQEQQWAVFCSSSYSMYGLLYVNSASYIYIRPKSCYYIIKK